ncbi:MAG TPA: HD domain-containing protein [Candidatus Paceibacterota bacterium]|nr:HD domain-containing protein [Candidatus Paceibacterota bacterium]
MTNRPPPYELFFTPLEIALSPNRFERVRFAYIVSKYGHAGQVREDGTRYFDHPKAAAWIFISELNGRDARAIVDILLHDLSEDAYLLSTHRISMNFGPDIALDVRALTKLPKGKETTETYLKRIIQQGPWAIVAKLCDRLHNLRTLGSCSPEKRKEQIEETRAYHLPLLVPALKCHGEPWSGYAEALEQKMAEAIESLPL